MKKLSLIFAAFAVVALSGCATQAELSHDALMLDKQIVAKAAYKPTPILQIKAKAGESIEMKGVELFTVYGQDPNAGKTPDYTPRPTAGQVVFGAVLETAKAFVPVWINSQNQTTQRLASDNNVKLEGLRWGTVSNIATQGIDAAAKPPLVVEPTVVFAPAQ